MDFLQLNFLQLSVKPLLLIAIGVAAALVYLPFLAVGAARVSSGYDMGAPRAMFDKLPEWGKRATWAHQNAWESFLLFTAAALMAYVSGANGSSVRMAIATYLGARLLFPVFYIVNVPILRSLMFAVGTGSIFTLMSASIQTALAAAK
jgi:uncharacterized MAPEG superfamily protein